MKTDAGFAHRQNADGTVDSICLFCYLTVATAARDEELINPEETHRCRSEDLSNAGQLHDARYRSSAEARKKIADAQRKRRAKAKKTTK